MHWGTCSALWVIFFLFFVWWLRKWLNNQGRLIIPVIVLLTSNGESAKAAGGEGGFPHLIARALFCLRKLNGRSEAASDVSDLILQPWWDLCLLITEISSRDVYGVELQWAGLFFFFFYLCGRVGLFWLTRLDFIGRRLSSQRILGCNAMRQTVNHSLWILYSRDIFWLYFPMWIIRRVNWTLGILYN